MIDDDVDDDDDDDYYLNYYYYEGSVHLSMPRHDYVKSGRLAVTDKTKPIKYIFTHLKLYILFNYIQ